MAFYKLTFNQKYRCVTVYNYGCNFRCPVCSYKLRSGADGIPGQSFPRPETFPALAEFKKVLAGLLPALLTNAPLAKSLRLNP